YLRLKSVNKVIVTELADGNVVFKPLSKGIMENGKLVWSQLLLAVNTVEYNWAYVSHQNKIGEQLIKVNSNDNILSCCEQHTFSLNEYLKRNEINEYALANGVKQIPQEAAVDMDSVPIGKKEMLAFMEVKDKLYLNKDFSENGEIRQIAIPFWYDVGYHKSVTNG
ncbi:MAG: hypothetical protein H0W84_00540, partial [Bacteroidetes bacterium]|nr:hypothetical protein [Bacteroidota bacterium]